jgi:hypothetical protein
MDPDPDSAVFALTFKTPAKTNLKNKKKKRSHKTVGIKVFLTIFAC